MKKLKVIIPLILILMAIVATPVLASDITDAKWTGDIKVTNAGTAASGVATVFDLDEDILISGNYILNDLSNLAIRDPSGADAAYMPGWGADPWCLHVPSIGAGGIQNYRFYAGGSTPMGGKMAYFPGDAGLTINDAAALELGSNFEIELPELYIDPTRKGYILNKSGAIALYTLQGQLFAGINPISGTKNSYYNEATNQPVYGGRKRGNYFNDFTKASIITSGALYLYKTGSPTGTAYYRIYDAGDGSLLGTIGEIDVTTLTTTSTLKTFDTNSVLVPAGTNIYAVIEFNGGDASNRINTSRHVSSSYGSYAPVTYTAGTWSIDFGTADITRIGYTSASASLLTTALTGEHTLKLYADGVNFGIDIDGVNQAAIAWSGNVTDNANNYIWFADGSVPYVRELKVTINDVLQQHLVYQYAATPVTDISGQNNQPSSVSIRTTSSDADVTGTFANLRPMAAAVATYTPGGASELITTPPVMPDNMYDEDYDNIPGAAVVNALLDAGNIPRTFFWFPAIILLAIAVGFGVCVLTRSLMGMALSMTAVIVIFSFMGPIPFWVIIPFGLFALAIIIKRENPGGF